jgi:hypothetical protein
MKPARKSHRSTRRHGPCSIAPRSSDSPPQPNLAGPGGVSRVSTSDGAGPTAQPPGSPLLVRRRVGGLVGSVVLVQRRRARWPRRRVVRSGNVSILEAIVRRRVLSRAWRNAHRHRSRWTSGRNGGLRPARGRAACAYMQQRLPHGRFQVAVAIPRFCGVPNGDAVTWARRP